MNPPEYGGFMSFRSLVKINNFGLGTHWVHKRFASGGIEALCDVVEAIGIQMAIEVERHGRGLVAEHLLHDLDVGTRGDRKAGGGVPQFMRMQARNAERVGGLR